MIIAPNSKIILARRIMGLKPFLRKFFTLSIYDRLTPNTFAHSDKGTGDKIFVFIACVFLFYADKITHIFVNKKK